MGGVKAVRALAEPAMQLVQCHGDASVHPACCGAPRADAYYSTNHAVTRCLCRAAGAGSAVKAHDQLRKMTFEFIIAVGVGHRCLRGPLGPAGTHAQ